MSKSNLISVLLLHYLNLSYVTCFHPPPLHDQPAKKWGIFNPTQNNINSFPLKSMPTSLFAQENYNEDGYVHSHGNVLSAKITRSLDLFPLVESISKHCATRRGRNAILDLIDPSLREGKSRIRVGDSSVNASSRRMNLMQYDPSKTSSKDSSAPPIQIVSSPIISIAKSALEAREEYQRVEEAMNILNKAKKDNSPNEKQDLNLNQSKIITTIPPIYGFSSSPWDTNDPISDDDEWLQTRPYEVLDLENIIQAEQVIKTLLECQHWAEMEMTRVNAPSLSRICETINESELNSLYEELKDSVIIKRENSVSDLSGSKSYSFKLNEDRFPQLVLLRKKEREIMITLDKGMQDFLQKVNGKGKLKAFEMDGRLVVPAPRKIANSLGTVRGFSKKGNMSYVEPASLVEKSNELTQVREDMSSVEYEIKQRLSSSIFRNAALINSGLDSVARLDTIFARAVFGSTMNGILPIVKDEGIIDISSFVHPLVATKDHIKMTKEEKNKTLNKVVPIDLKIGGTIESDYQSLIISGPNGGGKTVAMKSFGLVTVMCKLGIPIPVNTGHRNRNNLIHRVDFFQNIFVEVGDQQSVLGGESTLLSRLNGYSEIIRRVSGHNTTNSAHLDEESKEGGYPSLQELTRQKSLVLLDELGGGTDPVAGAAIAQAILEKILETNRCRIILTTHSLQLKAIPLSDTRFQSAAVLLSDKISNERKYKLPSFQLSYGSIGDSYGLGAASRCSPSLPNDVLTRASDLIIGQEGTGEMMRNINDALEKEKALAAHATAEAFDLREDARLARDGTIALARACMTHFSRLENRLENIFLELEKDKSKDSYDVIGETLSEIRLIKKLIKTDEELLAERGLKSIPPVYNFREGEMVVIVKAGERDGTTATVIAVDSKVLRATTIPDSTVDVNIPWSEVTVMPSFDWTSNIYSPDGSNPTITFRPGEIALWDYSDYDTEFNQNSEQMNVRSVQESSQRLQDILSKIDTPSAATTGSKKLSGNKKGEPTNSYTSAHQRKAAKAELKKAGKKAKVKKTDSKKKG